MAVVLISDSVFGRFNVQNVVHQAFFTKTRDTNEITLDKRNCSRPPITLNWANVSQIGISGWQMSDGIPTPVEKLLKTWFQNHEEPVTFLVAVGINDLR